MKRKNKPIRRPDAVQPLPLPADADEIAFAHGVSRRVVVVDAAGVGVDAVGNAVVDLAGRVGGCAARQMAAVGKAHAQDGVTRL